MNKFAVNIVLTIVVGAALALLVVERPPAVWTWVQISGICLLGAGFVLWTVARFQLGASLTVTAQARQLVSAGVYSRIRNPIYVFGSCVVAGLILVSGASSLAADLLHHHSAPDVAGGQRGACAGREVWGPISRLPGWNLVLIARHLLTLSGLKGQVSR